MASLEGQWLDYEATAKDMPKWMPYTDRIKCAWAIEFIVTSHLESQGGYPFDFKIVDDKVYVAEVDDDGSSLLTVHSIHKILTLVDMAIHYISVEKDLPLYYALAEAQQEIKTEDDE